MVDNPNSKLMQEVSTNDDFMSAAQKIKGFCAAGDKSNISASFSDLAKMIKNKYRPTTVSPGSISMSASPVLGAAARKREYVARKAAETAAAAAAAANAAAANAARKAASNAANAEAAAAAAAAAETAAAANAEAAAAAATAEAAATAASVNMSTAQVPSNLNTIRQQVAKLEVDLQGIKTRLNTATAAGGKRRKTRSKRKSSTRRR